MEAEAKDRGGRKEGIGWMHDPGQTAGSFQVVFGAFLGINGSN